MKTILLLAASALTIALIVISSREKIRTQIVEYLRENIEAGTAVSSTLPAGSRSTPTAGEHGLTSTTSEGGLTSTTTVRQPVQPAPPGFKGPTGEPHIIGPRGNPPNY